MRVWINISINILYLQIYFFYKQLEIYFQKYVSNQFASCSINMEANKLYRNKRSLLGSGGGGNTHTKKQNRNPLNEIWKGESYKAQIFQHRHPKN